ncbi:MAG TPA: hypothetical protein VGF59_34700 [Bryobacteraceae bacterium]|jgi:hypothetical protein
MLNWISEFWCRKMHTRAMWPIHGRYVCPQCLREYPVVWESPTLPAETSEAPASRALPIASTVSLVQ